MSQLAMLNNNDKFARYWDKMSNNTRTDKSTNSKSDLPFQKKNNKHIEH